MASEASSGVHVLPSSEISSLYEVIGEPPSFFGGDQFKVTSSPKTLLNLIGPVGFAGTATTRNQHAEFDGHIFTFINLSKITYKVI